MSLDTKTEWLVSTWFAVTVIVVNGALTALALLGGAPAGRLLSGLVIGYFTGLLMWKPSDA